jgi:hypothetical protein
LIRSFAEPWYVCAAVRETRYSACYELVAERCVARAEVPLPHRLVGA